MFVCHDREPRRAVHERDRLEVQDDVTPAITAIASSSTRVAATSNLPARREMGGAVRPLELDWRRCPSVLHTRLLLEVHHLRLGASAGLRRCARWMARRAGSWGSARQVMSHHLSGQSVEEATAVGGMASRRTVPTEILAVLLLLVSVVIISAFATD